MNMKLIYGFHALTRYLRLFPHQVEEIYVNQDRSDPRMRDLLKLVESEGKRAIRVDINRLTQLAKSPKHQGVVAFVHVETDNLTLEDVLAAIPLGFEGSGKEALAGRSSGTSYISNLNPIETDEASSQADRAQQTLQGNGYRHDSVPLLLILDGITDPHNLGACLRVADAMGVHAVVSPKDRSVGINPTVSKVACGAAESVPYIIVSNLARTLCDLKKKGIWIVGTDAQASNPLYTFDQTGPLAWVIGAEGHGLRRLTREHCDTLVSIPLFGQVESLNVSVATGIVLAETCRQRRFSEFSRGIKGS